MSGSIRKVQTIEEVRTVIGPLRDKGKRVGFVPTMGALHEGHLSLVRGAAKECDEVVASVFVNPAQFGPGEDLDRYPRDLAGDGRMLEEAGATLLFAPCEETIYPPGPRVFIDVDSLSGLLCGTSRPGHFRGVATVVWKLLEIVNPHTVYFGAKDAQQVVVIRRMVEDLFGPWSIRSLPTVRESDGLALSSRNSYLDKEARAAAPALNRALRSAREAIESGERDTEKIVSVARSVLDAVPSVRVEYVSLVGIHDLQSVKQAEGDLLLAGAVRLGGARLIDNICLCVSDGVEEILP